MFHHYWSFIWGAMWPNVFAPSFWTLFGIGLAHFRSMHHIKKHNDLLDTSTPGGITDVLEEVKKMNNHAG